MDFIDDYITVKALGICRLVMESVLENL